MKKLGFALISLMFVVLLAGGLEAKEPEFSGEIDMPYAYRSQDINVFHNADDPDNDSKINADQKSDFVLAPLIILNMKWALADKVTAFLQAENRRLDGFGAAGPVYGTAANVDFGGGDNIEPAVEQAYIKVEGFLSEKLNLAMGIQDLKFTLREGEGAFFMDVAESATASMFVAPAVAAIPGQMLAVDNRIAARDATIRDTMEFSGLCFNYGSLANDNYSLDVLWGVTQATGVARNNDKLMGVNLSYKLPGEKNVLKVLLAQFANSDLNMDIMTIGAGADYFGAVKNLEIYGEAYMQTGTYSQNASGKDVDQSAQAFRLGGRYKFQHDLKPYVDFSYWNLSGGDDSATYKAGSTKYTENNHFVSYENSQSTMILEDNLFGLDLDSNYNAIKVEAGIETSLDINKDGKAEPVTLKLLIGQFALNEVPYTNDPLLGLKKTDDGLGTEIDLSATLHYTENLSFTLGIAMLSGGDFFGSVRYLDAAGKTVDFDSMTLASFGAKVKF